MEHHHLVAAAQHALHAINRSGSQYALCGGLAMAALGHPRATTDIDVVVDSEAEAQTALDELARDGWVAASQDICFDDGFLLRRRLLCIERQLVVLDVLRSPTDHDFTTGRTLGDFFGVACWIIHPRQLIAMKQLAGRPQDLADIDHLQRDLADD